MVAVDKERSWCQVNVVHRGRFSAIFAFFFMFCSRLSALISVLCDIFTVELVATVPPLLAGDGVDFTTPGTTDAVFPDFCDDGGSVLPSAVGRAEEKTPPLPQLADEELFASTVDGLVNAGWLFPMDWSDFDLETSAALVDVLVDVDDRLLRFLARLARPTSPLPASELSLTTVGWTSTHHSSTIGQPPSVQWQFQDAVERWQTSSPLLPPACRTRPNITSCDVWLVPPPGELNKRYTSSLILPIHCIICINRTSSTKLEVHNVSHCRQRRTEPRPQGTVTENWVKFEHVVFEIWEWTDIQTNRQTHWLNTLHPLITARI